MSQSYPDITISNAWYERAKQIMFPVTQTMAKGPSQYVNGVAPKYLSRGKDGHVWDVDGNEYVDYNMGIGPISLGYGYEAVDNAIKKQLEDGITFSLMHPLEVELSELIHRIIPNAEAVRIAKTGAEVCSAAVRISRAFTGRKKVLCCGYHGWHDWYIGTTSRADGIPQEIKDLSATFDYNNIESLKAKLDDDVACVILEPFIFEAPKDNFLEKVQALCQANGTLLIFDEMWTGFRVAVGGAQEYFGITPDLAVYSKAFANGMPIALLTGRKDVMQLFEKDVFFYSTFGGEALSMAAAMATIHEMIEKNVPAALAAKGKTLREGYNVLVAKHHLSSITTCQGFDCRTILTFNASAGDPLILKSFVQQEMIKRGVLWGGFHNVCFTHTDEDIQKTLAAYDEVLALLASALNENSVAQQLRGKPVEAVFRKVGDVQKTFREKELQVK
ncbi:MAG: aminotransferase class III-fold pyridoxal phosphate-dependent enzyme [Bacteroidetes bacterium]|nr:aminotransferase class III-fold pyridoxal phosphate-dependent enzyme [Bacteroidota bacterium]